MQTERIRENTGGEKRIIVQKKKPHKQLLKIEWFNIQFSLKLSMFSTHTTTSCFCGGGNLQHSQVIETLFHVWGESVTGARSN